MSCRETRPLLPLFFDGELEARQMRAVALHSTRCSECERELRDLERLQETVTSSIAAMVDEVDLGRIWVGVAPRLRVEPIPWYRRVRGWWEERESGWHRAGPVFAALAVATLVVAIAWRVIESDSPQIAKIDTAVESKVASVEHSASKRVAAHIDNSAVLDSVRSNVESVALMTEPETNTMVLWITDDAGAGENDLGGLR